MKAHIPNFITCLNLSSGCIGVAFAFSGRLDIAAYCVVAAGVFDFLDGLVARALSVRSSMGKELDSLADVVSFGLLPGAVLFQLLRTAWPVLDYMPYLGFAVTIFSALRLARFNIDDRQSSDFRGLNTPMNALYVVSLPFVAAAYGHVVYHPAFLVASIALTCWLLVSNIRLFSMKMGAWSWQKNRWKFVFLVLSVLLVGVLKFAAAPLVLVLYFLFSYLHFRQAV